MKSQYGVEGRKKEDEGMSNASKEEAAWSRKKEEG